MFSACCLAWPVSYGVWEAAQEQCCVRALPAATEPRKGWLSGAVEGGWRVWACLRLMLQQWGALLQVGVLRGGGGVVRGQGCLAVRSEGPRDQGHQAGLPPASPPYPPSSEL